MKVFVTVGTQLPFDRMVRAVDDWATEGGHDVFAQIGPTDLRPHNVRFRDFVDPATFDREYGEADLIIAHAGMGSILTALQMRKPIVIMPRVASLGEHRNDHQRSTADRFRSTAGVYVADDESALVALLSDVAQLAGPEAGFSADAQPTLLQAISDFVNDQPRVRRRARLAAIGANRRGAMPDGAALKQLYIVDWNSRCRTS